MRKFGKIIKELREEKGLSALQLSMLVNISNASISRWENNLADIKSDHILILAKFFNVSTDYLLGLED